MLRQKPMVSAEIKLETATAVLRGRFNPAIFQPRWFSAQGLIADPAADAAQIEIIHGQICQFSVDSFEIQVTEDRFIVVTSDAALYDPLRDLVLGTFSILKHTPLQYLGLNRIAHIQASSETAWDQLGHTLAPKTFWEPLLEKPGMRSLTIHSVRPDGYKGALNVKVEPSTRIEHGVLVDINDHFELESRYPDEGYRAFHEILESQWEISLSRAAKILEHVRTRI